MFQEIEDERRRLGLSQASLARAAGVHPTSYSALKVGRRAGQVATIVKLRLTLQRIRRERGE